MNENQKKVLIATGIALVIWSGYRLYIKRPIPPMRPVKSADTTSGNDSANFTGYSDMTGKNGPTITESDIEKMQVELTQINKLLDKGQGHLSTSQLNKLRKRKNQIEASGYIWPKYRDRYIQNKYGVASATDSYDVKVCGLLGCQ